MSTPTQHGNRVISKNAPKFDDYVVVDGTWRATDNTQHEHTMDGDSEPYNDTFNSPGFDARCEWMVKEGSDPAVKGTVVTDDESSPRKWLVLNVEDHNFGGRTLRQTVQLRYKSGYNPDAVAAS